MTLPALAALAAPTATAGQRPTHPFRVGEPFPTISLPSLEDDRPASIADFRGRRLIVHVFASW
jgi:hypothetical protein